MNVYGEAPKGISALELQAFHYELERMNDRVIENLAALNPALFGARPAVREARELMDLVFQAAALRRFAPSPVGVGQFLFEAFNANNGFYEEELLGEELGESAASEGREVINGPEFESACLEALSRFHAAVIDSAVEAAGAYSYGALKRPAEAYESRRVQILILEGRLISEAAKLHGAFLGARRRFTRPLR